MVKTNLRDVAPVDDALDDDALVAQGERIR